MYDKAVNKCFLALFSIPNRYKTQEICDRVISEDFCILVSCPDKYRTQRMCDDGVDYCLATLKFIP